LNKLTVFISYLVQSFSIKENDERKLEIENGLKEANNSFFQQGIINCQFDHFVPFFKNFEYDILKCYVFDSFYSKDKRRKLTGLNLQ
jgi:hypothetical protein